MKRENNIGFVIIGGGEKEEEYRKKIEQYGIKNIHFEKFKKKEELIEYYKASDIFIFPTREDIWGLVINEAMATGLPVISTDNCVAAKELIQDSKNGRVIKTESIEELIDAIEEYNKMSASELEKQGKISIDVIKNNIIENIAESHVEVFKRIVKEKK